MSLIMVYWAIISVDVMHDFINSNGSGRQKNPQEFNIPFLCKWTYTTLWQQKASNTTVKCETFKHQPDEILELIQKCRETSIICQASKSLNESLSLSLTHTLSLSLSRVLKFFVITILIDLIYSSTCLQFDTYFSKPFQHSCNWNFTEISRFQISLDIYKSKRVRTYICTMYIQTVRCVYY